MSVVRNARTECNLGTTPVGDLLPGWCRQDPINGVQLFHDKRVMFLLNAWRGQCIRATLARRVTNTGEYREFSIVVEAPGPTGPQQSHQVVWLENPDRGSLELLHVDIASEYGSLDAQPNLHFGHEGTTVRNGHRSPVYLSLHLLIWDGSPGSPPINAIHQSVLGSGRQIRLAAPYARTEINVRAAEPQLTTLYMAP